MDNNSIAFNGKHYKDPKKIANKLNQQYTPGQMLKPTKESRGINRHIKKMLSTNTVNITNAQTEKALKNSKNSKALGPDNISPIMLKHIGTHGINYLTNLYNNVINESIIPPIWKVGRIIPLLKPGKPADDGKSYRPISLLSPAIKILQRAFFSQHCKMPAH